MAEIDFPAELRALRATYTSIEQVSEVAKLMEDIEDLSEQAGSPNLWDDPAAAQKVTSKLSHAQSKLEKLRTLESRIDDLEVLVELAQEEGDADSLAEAAKELHALQKSLEDLEIVTLLAGEYDEREAVITIRSGAGGVDAADFAQMLLRMYLRWAERNGYPTSVLDTSYAEEAGLKSATFEVKAPYAFGTLSVEAGTHRLVRISPFDNQGRRQTSFAAVEVIPLIESTDSIDRGVDAERKIADPESCRGHARAAVAAAAFEKGRGRRHQEGHGRGCEGVVGRPDAFLRAKPVSNGQGLAHRARGGQRRVRA